MKRALRIALLLGLLVLISSLLAAATPGAPPTAPSLAISPTNWTSTTTVGTPVLQTFTVTFSGKGTSGPLAVGFSGSPPIPFAQTANDTCSGTSLSAKTPACSVEIQFAPPSAATYSATLNVWGRKLSKSATLSGTGQAATLPGLWISDAPWVFSNSPAVVTFTVTMEAPRASNVTFDWAATDDTAYWGSTCDGTADYTSAAMTGTGSITAGQTTTTIPFGACNNGPAHVPPITTPTYFFVTISNPSGATITNDIGKAEIRIS